MKHDQLKKQIDSGKGSDKGDPSKDYSLDRDPL